MSQDHWPDGPLLAFVGDDFTGSTDAMEAFTAAGVPTVLFLAPPEAHWVERFAGMRCIGLATTARSQSPAWMDLHLAIAFARMKAFGAPILHYKVCSTFDSSPTTGSIGRALDLGTTVMPADWSPMIVGAPRLKRYQAFGNLFAIADDVGYRLDRHPTMSRHPVTPMAEADLMRHLAQQTARRIGLIDVVAIKTGAGAGRRASLAGEDTPALLIDVMDEETLAEAGRLVWQNRGAGIFSASSSGLQYALAAYWRSLGLVPQMPSLPVAHPVDRIAGVSGSCSPATAAQIADARAAGFATMRLDIAPVLDPQASDLEITRCVTACVAALARGQSPLVYSAEGPDDPAVIAFDGTAASANLSRADAATRVGDALGEILRRLLDLVPDLRRIVVAGGDSSGAVASALDIAALSIDAGLAPGAPLCRVWSDIPCRDGLQIVLKGGQMGGPTFFSAVLRGKV